MTEYTQALNEVAKYLSAPVGFSDHDSPKEDSKVIIRQNNTIIQLLIQVLDKLKSVQSNKFRKIDVSKGFLRRDKTLQLVRQDSRPLAMKHRLSCKADDVDSIEEVIDIQRDLERYQKDTLRKIKPQQVYHMGMFESKSGLYRISREVELSVLTHPVDLRIVSKNIENELKYCGYKYIHQGMYIIGIKGMTRKKLGAKVLITLLDRRWESVDKAALGFLEGDMNENRLITYIAPDLMMPVKE